MEWIRATFEVDAASSDVDAVARAIAIEQSVEMPLDAIRQPRVLDEVAGRVVSVEPAERAPAATDGRTSPHRVAIELSAATDAGEGVQIVLVAPMLVGAGAFCELVEEHLGGMAVIAHPAYAGAARVDPPLLLGRLFRLFGADAVIFPNYGGRFAYSPERCRAIADHARRPWGGLRDAVPVPAGGMTVERVGELVDFFGVDSMLLVGGALLSAGDALPSRSREFVERVAGASHGRR
jgi:ribulose-bisphosphate carboxylase large chain